MNESSYYSTACTNSRNKKFLEGLVETGYYRFCQYVKSKTMHHIYPRWVGFIVLVGMFLLRITLLQQFYLITYALIIVLLAQCNLFWSPLNDITMFAIPRRQRRTNNDKNSVKDEEEEGNEDDDSSSGTTPTPTRRYPEYQVWWVCMRSVLVATGCTLFSILDIPVYGPILWAYLVLLCFFVLVQTMKHRHEVNRVPSTATNEDPNKLTFHGTKLPCVTKISLKPCGPQDLTAIMNITPWSSLRHPPPTTRLHLTPMIWKDFLVDLESSMMVAQNDRAYAISVIGKLCIVYLGCYIFFDTIYSSSYFLCDYDPTTGKYHGCHRFLWMFLVTHIPVVIYAIQGIFTLQKIQKERIANCLTTVEQVCTTFRTEHPSIVIKVTTNNWKSPPVLVEIGTVPTRSSSSTGGPMMTTSNDENSSLTPNPNTDITDSLLLAQVS